MKKINLAVIFGGKSREHEVSLSSASGVINNLNKQKYNIIPVAITKGGFWLVGEKGEKYLKRNQKNFGRENAISQEESDQGATKKDGPNQLVEYQVKEGSKKIDLILPIIHGPFGEDGKLQGLLEMLGLPYVFSGVLAHSLGMNKSMAKKVANLAGVPVAKELKLTKNNKINEKSIVKEFDLPLIIKPNELGSSVGVSLVKEAGGISEAIKKAFACGGEIIIEKFIQGRELTVTVMEKNGKAVALPVIEIIPKVSEIYDYKAKYQVGGSEHILPARLSSNQTKTVQDLAVQVFNSIGCRGLARADFLLDKRTGKFCFIDLNTIPGMTPTSLAPEAAKKIGVSFTKLLDILINEARGKN